MKLTRDIVGENTLAKLMDAQGAPDWVPRPQVYGGSGLQIIMAREQMGGLETGPLRWHISVCGPGRVPTWEEIVEVAHALRPGVPFVISVPPRSMWMNVHSDVLHLHETGDEALIEEWRANAMGHTPT